MKDHAYSITQASIKKLTYSIVSNGICESKKKHKKTKKQQPIFLSSMIFLIFAVRLRRAWINIYFCVKPNSHRWDCYHDKIVRLF